MLYEAGKSMLYKATCICISYTWRHLSSINNTNHLCKKRSFNINTRARNGHVLISKTHQPNILFIYRKYRYENLIASSQALKEWLGNQIFQQTYHNFVAHIIHPRNEVNSILFSVVGQCKWLEIIVAR